MADATHGDAVATLGSRMPRSGWRSAATSDGFHSYEDASGPSDPADIDDPTLGTAMLYTSGTTGRPKGVWRKLPMTRDAGALRLRADGDVHLCTGPLYHAAPLALRSLAPMAACGVTTLV